VVNEARFGMNRVYQYLGSGECEAGVGPDTSYFHTGAQSCGFPQIQIQGFQFLGGNQNFPKLQGPDYTFQVLDDLSFTRGKHAFKFGAEVRRMQYHGGTFRFGKGNIAFRGSGSGIVFNPNFGAAKLFVSDCTITNNGSSGISGGIVIKPGSGAQADVTINRTQIENNFFGIIADGTGGGSINGVVRDSVVSGNVNFGIVTSTSSASVILLIDNTTVTNNNYGLVAVGAGAGMVASKSNIMFNTTGLYTATGGLLGSYKNNNVGGNATDGAFNIFAGQQ